MQFTRTSRWSGITRTRELDVTPDQVAAWEGGMVIQRAMPHLTASEREWLISGLDEEEWATMCGPEEDVCPPTSPP